MQELTTPSGKKVSIKDFITARDRNILRAVLLDNIAVDPTTGQPKIGELKGDMLEKSERRVLEVVVVSYDGSSENIAERILDGSPADYDFIVAEANKVANLGPAK